MRYGSLRFLFEQPDLPRDNISTGVSVLRLLLNKISLMMSGLAEVGIESPFKRSEVTVENPVSREVGLAYHTCKSTRLCGRLKDTQCGSWSLFFQTYKDPPVS